MKIKKRALLPFLVSIPLITTCLLGGCLDDDRDGDGLPNSIENEGWPILVILLGDTNKTEIHVTSDPGEYDTDDDGLSDWEEFMSYHTNPREKDTDEDTFTDWEEINRYGTDPKNGFHDIDEDLFWDGDEVLYFRERGFDDDTIHEFLNSTDIDGDGTPDGQDMDPLTDLQITLHLQSINITAMDDDASPEVWEIYFRIIGDETIDIITDTRHLDVNTYYSLNLTWALNLSDEGTPGAPLNLLQISVWDNDTTHDDLARINNDSGFWGTDEFVIPQDTSQYTLEGTEGVIWFTITDTRVPWPPN
jgi:hypothetical protein